MVLLQGLAGLDVLQRGLLLDAEFGRGLLAERAAGMTW